MSDSQRHLIKLLPNKKAFFCKPDQRVLDAGLEAGIALPHSCRGGNCGRCVAKVLVGSYRYDRTTPPPGLTSDQRSTGMALLCQIVPETSLTVEIARSDEAGAFMPVVKLPCRIVARECVAPDVMKLTLQLPRTQPLDFRPGQYLDVLLDKGMRRSYSLANLPYSLSNKIAEPNGDATRGAATHLELHVRRVEGGVFSALVFDPDSASSLLRIEGPHGTFGWRPHEGPSLLIAGGTGFAPMRSMLLEAMARKVSRPVHLFWGGRNPQDVYDRSELLQWQEQYDWFSFSAVVESNPTDDSFLLGRAPEVAMANYTGLADAMIYASGPPGLVQSVLNECGRLGISDDRIVTDSFDYAA